jgi:hypothetical protein
VKFVVKYFISSRPTLRNIPITADGQKYNHPPLGARKHNAPHNLKNG